MESSQEKLQFSEEAWNSRDPERVALAYSKYTEWCNRSECITGRTAIVGFLQRKWSRGLNYKLKKILRAFSDNRITVRHEYEWQASADLWRRSYGNENWEYDENGLMARHSVNAVPLTRISREEKSTSVEGVESAKAVAS